MTVVLETLSLNQTASLFPSLFIVWVNTPVYTSNDSRPNSNSSNLPLLPMQYNISPHHMLFHLLGDSL